ncbi:hypothetical protein ACMFMF_003416 [Clarireedia jacksonii]
MFKCSTRWLYSYTRNVSPTPARVSSRRLTTILPPLNDSPALPHLKIPSSRLCYHWDTLPPTESQLSHAKQFFEREPPKFLWSAPKFHSMAFGDSPEVCFLGRSNVGKSSILNALLGASMAHTSSKPGHMPGYGKGGHSDWGVEIIKYIDKRKQLKRAFLLIDAEHGPKGSDLAMINLFNQHKVPFQVILSKIDKILSNSNSKRVPSAHEFSHRLEHLDKVLESTKNFLQGDIELDEGHMVGEIISCSSQSSLVGRRLGIDAVRFAMLRAAGLHFQPEVKLAPAVEIVPHEDIFRIQRKSNNAGS